MNRNLVPFLLENCRDRIYAQATQILDRELGRMLFGCYWPLSDAIGWDYERLRSESGDFGYTSVYLVACANFEEFSSSAKLSVVLKLAKLDLQKGSTIPELVLFCCFRFPFKEALESLIGFGRDQSQEFLVRSIFEFRNFEGFNCLMSIFKLATKYRSATNKYPSGPMLLAIEKSFFFLIDLAKSNNLDLNRILNQTSKNGETIFHQASRFSKKITKYLLEAKVRVNCIDYHFMTSSYRVRIRVYFACNFFSSKAYNNR